MKGKFIFEILILISFFGCGSDSTKIGNEDLHTYKVLPQDTDNAMEQTNKPHYVFLDSRVKQKGKLLVFIGGTNSAPSQYQDFCTEAAGVGYHVIDVNYLNTITTLACQEETDADCFTKFHDEIIFGTDASSLVDVDASNSLVNRILKLLEFLHKSYPNEGWNQYFTNNDLNYAKFVLAGHSQGGGHATYLAFKYEVDRLIVFSSPNDYSENYSAVAGWCGETFATSSDRFYGLMHKRDEVVPPSEQYAVWQTINLLNSADTVSADKAGYANFHALYTNFDADPSATSHSFHNVPVMDKAEPASQNLSHLKEVWRYLLGE
jgi:hypothetical protein